MSPVRGMPFSGGEYDGQGLISVHSIAIVCGLTRQIISEEQFNRQRHQEQTCIPYHNTMVVQGEQICQQSEWRTAIDQEEMEFFSVRQQPEPTADEELSR